MSQDAPRSRKEKKVLRDAERRRKGKKRKHDGVAEKAGVYERLELEKDFISLQNGDEERVSDAVRPDPRPKKRKRQDGENENLQHDPNEDSTGNAEGSSTSKPKKRRKTKVKMEDTAVTDGEKDASEHAPGYKSRFILFIGNLPYNTTDASLQAHFKKLQPFTLRHRTDAKTKKSKGFAFLEFENYDRMKTCLKLYHHSIFDPQASENGGDGKGNGKGGRRINVELTAGGGGKAEGRKEKIKAKNARLDGQRKRRAEQGRKEKVEKGQQQAELGRDEAPKTSEENRGPVVDVTSGMHPSRLARLKR